MICEYTQLFLEFGVMERHLGVNYIDMFALLTTINILNLLTMDQSSEQ